MIGDKSVPRKLTLRWTSPDLTDDKSLVISEVQWLGSQHSFSKWLGTWWHQAITLTNVDWWSVKSSNIHFRAISQRMHQPSITKICLKISSLKFHLNFPGDNELTSFAYKYIYFYSIPIPSLNRTKYQSLFDPSPVVCQMFVAKPALLVALFTNTQHFPACNLTHKLPTTNTAWDEKLQQISHEIKKKKKECEQNPSKIWISTHWPLEEGVTLNFTFQTHYIE